MIDYAEMKKNRLFWITSSLLAIGILGVLNYGENDVNIHPSYQTSSMNNPHLTRKDENKISWELFADKATLPEGKKKIHLESMSLRINKSPAIYLTSGTGTYEIESENVTLNEPVELNMEDKKFQTRTLTWNSNNDFITTDTPVKFTGKNFLIEGDGLNAHIKQQKVKITKNVKAIFYH
jgi:LPS export ABC transporter protein LptC